MSLKEEIQKAALELGFCYIGFARSEALPEAPLLNWLLQGHHGSMDYMARDPSARLDPRKLLPGCRTVISLAMNYYTPFPTKADARHGRVSRYAWGRDYHKTVRKRLRDLERKIADLQPGAQTKICVDTSPILEKAWAERAGIGWQGKHSNLITRDFGSWVFLGEILVDFFVKPDSPHPDFCGTCTRCLESCPTQAIVSPYVVDATRCISYLTIESKEPAPNPLAKKSGDWIYGCDICQEVCPWNRFAQTTEEPDFYPRAEHQRNLESWIGLDEETFRREFAGTPFMRPKLPHMVENVRIALRNAQQEWGEKERKATPTDEDEALHPGGSQPAHPGP